MEFDILTTERLLLRKWTPKEFRYLFENYSEKRIRKELGITTDAEYQKELEKYKEGYSSYKRSLVLFQMIDRLTGKIIGGCGFHNWMLEHNRAELGYALLKDEHKGKGLMTQALKVVIDHGFNKMNLNRIEACVGPDNTASLKLLEKYGFTQEGYMRQHYFKNDILHDSYIFSLLREEYNAAKKK